MPAAHHVRSFLFKHLIRQSWKKSSFPSMVGLESERQKQTKCSLSLLHTSSNFAKTGWKAGQVGAGRRKRSQMCRDAHIFRLLCERTSHPRDDSATASPAPISSTGVRHTFARQPPRPGPRDLRGPLCPRDHRATTFLDDSLSAPWGTSAQSRRSPASSASQRRPGAALPAAAKSSPAGPRSHTYSEGQNPRLPPCSSAAAIPHAERTPPPLPAPPPREAPRTRALARRGCLPGRSPGTSLRAPLGQPRRRDRPARAASPGFGAGPHRRARRHATANSANRRSRGAFTRPQRTSGGAAPAASLNRSSTNSNRRAQ